ncbi:FAD-dependent monooxygenase [Actinokineospora sp. NBRC 105648]|uniref:FAD-dependent monooxygenase n=1 Tax=Actinokineospora sp. NBRC 105648 TaxID=3032206 RepID=UPI0024A3DB1F|nr:FAD-dependent monooxygenase [Actinokineospora sp. NBRC 105648]GLZ38181.1 hypothetical protein Acsp05_18050 [Actinokineospora sp. NBRC 105648]
MPSVLISGASVAGPALAFWLTRSGFEVTVVERAPGPRPGGQAVDIRGVALDVADRMGLLADFQALEVGMRGMSMVDADGTVLMSTTETTFTGGPTDSRDIEILRDDLSDVLYRETVEGVEYLFGDSITALTQDADGVDVTFATAAPRRFDLVVGADGLHSRVRSLAFGDEAQFIRHLGVYLAVFSLPNHLGLDRWQTFHQFENGMAGIYSVRENTEARGMLGFMSPPLDYDYRDADAQRHLLADRLTGTGWEIPALVKAMWTAPDFYFDSMSQIKMDAYTTGRVALLGDAAYCGSPLTGQGTSLALVGAYVLAGELATADDHTTAFAAYDAKMRPFVELNHRLATDWQGERPPQEAIDTAARALTLDDYAVRTPQGATTR